MQIESAHLNPNPAVIHLGLYSKEAYEALTSFFYYMQWVDADYKCNFFGGLLKDDVNDIVHVANDGELYLKHIRYGTHIEIPVEKFYESMFIILKSESAILDESGHIYGLWNRKNIDNAKIIINEIMSNDCEHSEEFKQLVGSPFDPFTSEKLRILRRTRASKEEIKKTIEEGWKMNA